MNLSIKVAALLFSVLSIGLSESASADVIFNNNTPNNLMAAATRTDVGTPFEIETADDFVTTAQTSVNSATFTGLIVPGSSGTPSVSQVVIEIYRVFPNDSNVGRTTGPPTFSTPSVPTRVNSPSDVAFDSRDSAQLGLNFTTMTLAATFTALNSVKPSGIHPSPNQTTLGNGPLTGAEVSFTVNFTTPFNLPADHYFFVPQVTLTNGAQFYWLSASRPISGAGTTPFPPGFTDLQSWTRDAMLDPDWLRIGTDIVGAGTFNAAFELDGTVVPLPGALPLFATGLGALGLLGWRRKKNLSKRCM
jgi:hypothetical protein